LKKTDLSFNSHFRCSSCLCETIPSGYISTHMNVLHTVLSVMQVIQN